MRQTGRRGAAAVLLASLLCLTACGSGDDDSSTASSEPVESTASDETTEPSETSTTEDPHAEVEAEVEAAYLEYWDALLEIYAARDPENPLIAEVAVSDQREGILDAITQDIIDGRSVRPPENSADYSQRVLDINVEDEQATITACVVDGAVIVDNKTEAVLDDAVVTLLVEATMTSGEGAWKVASNTVLDRRDGRWDCDR